MNGLNVDLEGRMSAKVQKAPLYSSPGLYRKIVDYVLRILDLMPEMKH